MQPQPEEEDAEDIPTDPATIRWLVRQHAVHQALIVGLDDSASQAMSAARDFEERLQLLEKKVLPMQSHGKIAHTFSDIFQKLTAWNKWWNQWGRELLTALWCARRERFS